jgi:hypothetical protein
MAKKTKKNLSLINVIAEGKDERGRRYFLFGADGEPIVTVPPVLASRLIENRQKVLIELAEAGFGLFTSPEQRVFLESVQKWGKEDASFKVATKLGWNGWTYILPDKTFNPQQNVYRLLEELDLDAHNKYRASP